MIYEYFRAIELMKQHKDSQTCLQISTLDGDRACLSVSEMLSDMILERLYRKKSKKLAQFQIVLSLYDQETARNKGKPNSSSQLKTAVKFHIEQMMRTRNFRVRNDVVDGGSVTKSQKGKKAYTERKVE